MRVSPWLDRRCPAGQASAAMKTFVGDPTFGDPADSHPESLLQYSYSNCIGISYDSESSVTSHLLLHCDIGNSNTNQSSSNSDHRQIGSLLRPNGPLDSPFQPRDDRRRCIQYSKYWVVLD
eukprot:COSAG02_NODE_5705_length_4106_cov_8.387821_3_plen_121_part_00